MEFRVKTDGLTTVAHRGWRIHIPKGAELVYPVKPFNPYHPDGEAKPEQYRAMIHLPLDDVREYEMTIEENA